MFTDKLGELAALATAACWVVTSLSFAAAGRRIGPTAVNLTRLLLATAILASVGRLRFGVWIPEHDATGYVLLALSGLIGLAIGDQFLFTALVDVGSRMSTLLMTLAPPVTAILAWPLLDERLGLLAMLGMAVTVGGICMVVLERPAGDYATLHRNRRRGILFASLAAVCQALGLVLAKLGIGHQRLDDAHLDPWSATLIRMTVAAAAMLIVTGALRARRNGRRTIAVSPETEHLPPPARASRWPTAIGLVVLGAIFGPVLGVWLSLVAIDNAETGIAATLMSMTPVLILPLAVLIEGERFSWRAVAGALVAIGGVALLTNV